MKQNKVNLLIIIVVTICVSLTIIGAMKLKENKQKYEYIPQEKTNDFNSSIIKQVHKENDNKNYLISPYSILIALNMLREGADGNTKKEIDKVIGNSVINDISIKDKLNIANAIFIKDDYKNDVKKNFINSLNSKYHAEVLYDKFENPTVINNWVREKTNGMIDKLLDQINKDYVMGLANALALDVEWTNPFECINTKEEEFTKIDNHKIKVEMMHQSYSSDAKYLRTDDAYGIVLPYLTNSDRELEFVALMPNTNVNDYINNLTKDKLERVFKNSTLADEKHHINLSLPRFTYEYEVNNFIEVLKNMGIKEAFDKDLANFKKMIEIRENVYVGEAIHKTKIELNEKGTKAAAVTYFGMFKATGIIEKDYEEINIKFNKPFMYMIRERNTGEIIFFGTVFNPNIWNGNTCSN